jgi:hypothetical protein
MTPLDCGSAPRSPNGQGSRSPSPAPPLSRTVGHYKL